MSRLTIQYKGNTYGDGNDVIINSMDGIDGLELRTSETTYIGLDGGGIFNSLYSMRTIGINMTVRGNTEADYFTNKRALIETFSRSTDYSPLTITTWDGVTRVIDVKTVVTPMIRLVPGELNRATFRVELKAGVPFFRGESNVGGSVGLAAPAGYDIPYSIPYDMQGNDANQIVINNAGNIAWYPAITITAGSNLTSPRISNLTTGEFFFIDNTITAGNFVVVSFGANGLQVKLNNTTNYYRYFKGSLPLIEAGNNTLSFTASTIDSTSSANITFYSHYLSA